MGVIFAKPRKKDRILKVAKAAGAALEAAGEAAEDEAAEGDGEESQGQAEPAGQER